MKPSNLRFASAIRVGNQLRSRGGRSVFDVDSADIEVHVMLASGFDLCGVSASKQMHKPEAEFRHPIRTPMPIDCITNGITHDQQSL